MTTTLKKNVHCVWQVWQISALVCRPHLIGGHRLWSRLLQSADTSLALHLWALHCSVYSAEMPKLVKKSPITSFPSICILVCVAQCDCSKCCIDTQKCRMWNAEQLGRTRAVGSWRGETSKAPLATETRVSHADQHIGLYVALHTVPV